MLSQRHLRALIAVTTVDIFLIPGAGDIAKAILNELKKAMDGLIKESAKFFNTVIKGAIDAVAGPALDLVLYVPAPKPVGVYFSQPSNAPWGQIYSYIMDWTLPIGFALLIVSWAVGQAASSIGVLNAQKTRSLDRGLYAGIFIVPITFTICAIFLQLVNQITMMIAPAPREVTNVVIGLVNLNDLFGNGAFWIVAYLLGSVLLTIALLAVAVNILRIVILFIITVLMPILAGLKLAGIPYFEGWADKFINMYVSLALSSIFMAASFRLTVLLLKGGVNIAGLPGSEFMKPIFAMVPFAIGVVVPLGAMSNSLNVMQAASMASAAGAIGSSAASTAKKTGSTAKSGAKKAGLDDKLEGRAKEEYTRLRDIRSDDEDELGPAEFDEPNDRQPSGVTAPTTLPDTVDDSNLPASTGYDARADNADFVGSDSEGPEGTDETSQDGPVPGADGSDDPGGAESGASAASGKESVSDDHQATATTIGGQSGSGSASEASSTEKSSSTQTTVGRLSNDPYAPAEDDVSLNRVKYSEEAPGIPNEDFDGGYFEDSDGNKVPVRTGPDGPDLEDGQTYDIEGMEIQEEIHGSNDEPAAVENGKVTPPVTEQGRYVSLSPTEDTEVTEQPGQSYVGDFAGRVKQRSKNTAQSTVDKATSPVDTTKQGLGAAKDSIVDKADDALLKEEDRGEYGQLPSEIQEGTRVHAQEGSRITAGNVRDTWTDKQTDRDMAAVDFDGEDDPTVVPQEELSLSVSSKFGSLTEDDDK